MLQYFSELSKKLQQPPTIAKPDEGPMLHLALEEDEDKEKDTDMDAMVSKNGSVACKFIELSPWHYTQEERQSYWQTLMQTTLCMVSSNHRHTFHCYHIPITIVVRIQQINLKLEKNKKGGCICVSS